MQDLAANFLLFLIQIREQAKNQNSYVILQRGIKQVDIENAILTGKIIEHYPDDYPHPSCLILGLALDTKEMHVVCGIANDELYMITAYRPDSNKWDKNFSERKRT